jgi:hypothetical protein
VTWLSCLPCRNWCNIIIITDLEPKDMHELNDTQILRTTIHSHSDGFTWVCPNREQTTLMVTTSNRLQTPYAWLAFARSWHRPDHNRLLVAQKSEWLKSRRTPCPKPITSPIAEEANVVNTAQWCSSHLRGAHCALLILACVVLAGELFPAPWCFV